MLRNNNLTNTLACLKNKINKVLICPDKFKFSLSSQQVAQIIQNTLPHGIQSQIITLADGGEGSLDAISTKLKGNWINCQVKDPLFRNITAQYYYSHHHEAFIQMARASGLGLLRETERSITKTSTFGTGQLILDSLKRGSKKVNLLIGGSATTDGGIGCASALGFKFYDKNNTLLDPIGQNLIKIQSIRQEEKEVIQLLNNAKISVYTDVTNPLFGSNGASVVYGPQKGGNSEDIRLADRGLENLNSIFKEQFKVDANIVPGSGAAGGLGAGCLVLLKAELLRGIDLIFTVTEFEEALKTADLVITGQGKFDSQTFEGKVVKGVIDRCLSANKPVIVFCAICESDQQFIDHHPEVQIIQLLSQQQKNIIDPKVTRSKIIHQVANLFR